MWLVKILLSTLMAFLFVMAQAQDASDAKLKLQQGKLIEAAEAYSKLIKSYPNDPDHWLGRGLVYARQGLWHEATTDLEKAVSLAPGYADAWSALADVYRWSGQAAAAADAYTRLTILRPSDAQAQVLRARSLLVIQDVSDARLAIQRARELGAAEESLPIIPLDHPSAPVPESVGQPSNNDRYKWALSAGSSQTSSGTSNAYENSISLRRYGEMGSIAIESLGLRRYGYSDQAWAIDAYPRLWQGAYANLRYQRANEPDLYPVHSWRAELYQNVGGGWELAASRDFLGFGTGVRIDGISAGNYWGNFFARWRHQQITSDSSSGKGDRLFIRYYYEGDADHYVEVNASQGRSDDFSSALIQQSRSNSRGLSWYHFFNRDWGFKFSASESNDSSSASNRARDLGLGLTHRW